jgi:hypothetical protein
MNQPKKEVVSVSDRIISRNLKSIEINGEFLFENLLYENNDRGVAI